MTHRNDADDHIKCHPDNPADAATVRAALKNKGFQQGVMKRRYIKMKKCLLILMMVVVTASTLLGCAAPATAKVKVYGKDDTTIFAKVGEEFTITIDENPTTGYQWRFSVSDEKIVSMSKDEYVPDSRAEDVEGAGGQRVLTFKANAKGNTTINMVYERSWEKSEDDEKLSYEIEVK
jgi:inhibitor of cysteine peptidase